MLSLCGTIPVEAGMHHSNDQSGMGLNSVNHSSPRAISNCACKSNLMAYISVDRSDIQGHILPMPLYEGITNILRSFCQERIS